MFPLDLDIHGIWLTVDIAAGNPRSYRKSAIARNPVFAGIMGLFPNQIKSAQRIEISWHSNKITNN